MWNYVEMEGPKVLIMQIFSARIDPKHNAQQCRALRFWVLADPTSTISQNNPSSQNPNIKPS